MVLNKSYEIFAKIVSDKTLKVTYHEDLNYFHLIAKDGIVFYQTFVQKKNDPNYEHFIQVIKPNSFDKFPVGNVEEELIQLLKGIGSGTEPSSSPISKQNETQVTSRSEMDISNTSLTVSSNKKFILTSFIASYDAQSTVYVRLKKQTGGSGEFKTVMRITLNGNNGQSSIPYNFGNGIYIGMSGDIFKITVEGSVSKGSVWAGFTGVEI